MSHLLNQINNAVAACIENAKQYGITPQQAEQCDGKQITYFASDSRLKTVAICKRCVFTEE